MSRRRGLTTFGAGVTAGAAAFALLTTGVLAAGTSGLVGAAADLVRVPAVAADELPAFGDCEQLRRWYVDRALPQVGPWGFGGPQLMYLRAQGPVPAGIAEDSATGRAVGSSGTGTNVQETDVDEADTAKTDGTLLVRVVEDELVVTDVSGTRPLELSRTTLPGPDLVQPELLLDGEHVIVVGDEQGSVSYTSDTPSTGRPTMLPVGTGETRAHVIALDIADTRTPRVTSHQSIDGSTVAAREYAGGVVRIVVTTGPPSLDFVQPNRDRSGPAATRENRRIVREASVEQWLPGVRTGSGGTSTPLLDCADVRHPLTASGLGTISVLTLASDDPAEVDATAVTAAGDLVYSSADRLYVATRSGGWGTPVPLDDTGVTSEPVGPTHDPVRTVVHSFALDGAKTSYVASGSLPGQVRDRWSFSEYDGHLRVATSLGPEWQPRESAVVVLTEDGTVLRETGRVTGLGRGEEIRSVRWFGDLAIVVTFRQIDPLYTVDLSDPSAPRVVGALKIPGFSSYLHPVGGDLLLGIGHDVSARTGSDRGAQAATFDLADLAGVRRVDTLGFGPETDLGAGWDPRAFTYLPPVRTFVTPVEDWRSGRSRFEAVRIDPDGTLHPTASWVTRTSGETVRALPIDDGRVALVGDVVRLVDVR